MWGESVSAAVASAATWPRELLDALPASVVIVEPGSARVLFANRAALELTGEESPVGRPVTEWIAAGACRDAEGRPFTDDALPSVRAARGERVRGTMVTCPTTRGERTLRTTAQPVTAPDGAPVMLVSFEDVTELRAAQLGERLVGEDLRAILEGIADSVTAQGPDGSLVYANEAAVRVLGFPSAEALLSAPSTARAARSAGRASRPSPSATPTGPSAWPSTSSRTSPSSSRSSSPSASSRRRAARSQTRSSTSRRWPRSHTSPSRSWPTGAPSTSPATSRASSTASRWPTSTRRR